MRVLLTDKIDPEAIALLRDRGHEVIEDKDSDADQLVARLRELAPDAWIIRSGTRIEARHLEAVEGLKVIGRAGVGVDNIDLSAATRRGVAVLNTPTGNTTAAVEHAMALLLSLARNVPQAHASLAGDRAWKRSQFTGVELYGKTIAVLGLGKIGSRVATRCRAFEMTVLAYDPYLSAERAQALGVERVDELDEALARADFITLHLPGTPETQQLINAERLARCKPGARLVNCARGVLIDEAALADALASGQLAGAAIDVFAKEPPFAGDGGADSPLLDAPNVVLTPHLGASTVESQRNVGIQVAEQVADALEKGVFRQAVNIPVRDWATMEKLAPELLLVERLGHVACQFVGGAISQVDVEYLGGPFDEIPALNNALLKGVLAPILGEAVNTVNASVLATERGIKLTSTQTEHAETYREVVRLTVTADGQPRVFAATRFFDGIPRLVTLDAYPVEVVLGGVLLMFVNNDTPGVIGSVGMKLGEHEVNIASFNLGRTRIGGEALAVLHLDSPISDALAEELRAIGNMRWVKQIVLPE